MRPAEAEQEAGVRFSWRLKAKAPSDAVLGALNREVCEGNTSWKGTRRAIPVLLEMRLLLA